MEKGCKKVGKWGFPFPNHNPVNIRLQCLNLKEKSDHYFIFPMLILFFLLLLCGEIKILIHKNSYCIFSGARAEMLHYPIPSKNTKKLSILFEMCSHLNAHTL